MTGVCRGASRTTTNTITICAGLWIVDVECVGEKLQGHNVLPKGKEEEEEAKR